MRVQTAGAMLIALPVLLGGFIVSRIAGLGDIVEHGLVAIDAAPDGKELAFTSASGELYILELKSRKVRQILAGLSGMTTPRYSPDGKSIAFSAPRTTGEGNSIFLVPSRGGTRRSVTKDKNVSDHSPSFSQDGRTIHFARAYRHRPYSMGGWRWDSFDLCSIRTDGYNFRRITREAFYSMGSSANANGKDSIVFVAEGHGDKLVSSLYSADISGKTPPKLLSGPSGQQAERIGSWASDVAVSKDRRRLVFISDRSEPFKYDLLVSDLSGSGVRSLGATQVSSYNQQPTFLPGKQGVLFLAGTEWNAGSRPIFSLWMANSDGKFSKIAGSGLFTTPRKWKG